MKSSNNGLLFENMIERSLDVYERRGRALIKKVATPWNIERNKLTGAIFKAFPLKKSTVDYIGLAKGTGIAFEAKSTISETSLPLKNIADHQIDFLKEWRDQGGISFLLISFLTSRGQDVFFLELDQLIEFKKENRRKSIPRHFFEESCPVVPSRDGVFVDFLPLAMKEGSR